MGDKRANFEVTVTLCRREAIFANLEISDVLPEATYMICRFLSTAWDRYASVWPSKSAWAEGVAFSNHPAFLASFSVRRWAPRKEDG